MRHSRCCRGTARLMGVITFLPFLPQQYILAEHIRPRNPPTPPHQHLCRKVAISPWKLPTPFKGSSQNAHLMWREGRLKPQRRKNGFEETAPVLPMEPNYFPCLGHSIVEAEHRAALFGGHMWSGYKDHTTPFQSRTATGNETLQKEQGLLKK